MAKAKKKATSMPADMYKHFVVRFLKEKKIFKIFTDNFKKRTHMIEDDAELDNRVLLDDLIEYILKKDNQRHIFAWAFQWDMTEQGFNYWCKIDLQFKRVYGALLRQL